MLGRFFRSSPALRGFTLAGFLFPGALSAAPRSFSLPSKGDEYGVVARYDDGRLVVRGCLGASCGVEETYEIPRDVERSQLRSETLTLAPGRRVLHLEFGGATRAYHVLLAPTRKGEENPGVRLVLRGYSGGPKDSSIEVAETAKEERSLFVTRPSTRKLCGRPLRGVARRYVPGSYEFVETRLPPLGASERKSATPLEAKKRLHPLTEPDSWTLLLDAETDLPEGGRLFDGALVPSEAPPWTSASLSLGESAGLVLVASEEAGPSTHYLASDDRIFSITLPGGGAYEVRLPEELRSGCLSFVSDGKATPLVEVAGLWPSSTAHDAASLALDLEGEGAPRAKRALALWLATSEGDAGVARVAAKLSPGARAAILSLVERTPRLTAVRTLERILAVGSPGEVERAEREFERRGATAAPELERGFSESSPSTEASFARLLRNYAPSSFFAQVAPRLDEKSAARRAKLRDVFVGALREPALVAEYRAELASTARSRAVRIELLRALGPRAVELLPESLDGLRRLSAEATFAETMKLVGPWVALLGRDGDVDRALETRLTSARVPRETAALLTAVFEVASEGSFGAEAERRLRAFSEIGLGSAEMRARRAAADFLARAGAPHQRVALEQLAEMDAWPSVRESSLRALDVGTEALASFVVRRLEADPHPRVRAAAARRLETASDEASVEALRVALADDEAPEVRARAAESLGRRCDVASAERLTKLSRKLVERGASEAELDVAWGALAGLLALSPPDLETRLAPLLGSEVPGPLRGQIRLLLERGVKTRCGAGERKR